jgi:GAF domain-containing protein
LADLGCFAVQSTSLDELFERVVNIVSQGAESDFCKILEYLPLENRLLVRAGIGWHPGVVGHATIGADLESPAGYALHTGEAVIANDLEHETRFRRPELLAAHGVRRAMNVILVGEGKPYGVLEVDNRAGREFSEHDIAFLQGAANVLGLAIERKRYEQSLKIALDRQTALLNEVNHRVKNSLQLVASMLHLQARSAGRSGLGEQLDSATRRVAAVSRAHQ